MGNRPKNKQEHQAVIEAWQEVTKKSLCKKCGSTTLAGLDTCASYPKCKHRSKRSIGFEAIFGDLYKKRP